MFPVFEIIIVNTETNSIVGSLDRLSQGKENWIGDNFVGALLKENLIAFGRWHKANDKWQFDFDKGEETKLSVKPNESIFAIDGYWGERIEIVYDSEIHWDKVEFIKQGDWDHDHCAICWASISELKNKSYYLGSNKHPVCNNCYDNYVSKNNTAFVPSA